MEKEITIKQIENYINLYKGDINFINTSSNPSKEYEISICKRTIIELEHIKALVKTIKEKKQ